MNSSRAIPTGTVENIAKTTDPEDIRELDVSLKTLDRHMRAMLIARDQEQKKEAFFDLISPSEVDPICLTVPNFFLVAFSKSLNYFTWEAYLVEPKRRKIVANSI